MLRVMVRKQKPTLADIARTAGVSIATVSRALSEPRLVQPETLRKIQSVASGLGYMPNRRARALVSGRSNTIGVAVPTLNSPIFSACLHEMQKAFSTEGYQLLIASHEYDPKAEAAALAQLVSHGVDGLIVVGAERPKSTWALIANADVPLVQLWEGVDAHDRVLVDNHRAGREIAQHVLALGHRRIGVISGVLSNNDRQQARLAGIRAALADAGLALPRSMISEQPLSIAAGRSGSAMLLELMPPPSAIIGTIDLLAIGGMIEAQGRGIKVPAEISFAGIDNVDMAAHVAPSLTTIDMPAASIGAEAAAMMLRRLDRPAGSKAQCTHLPINLVVRRSTAAVG